MVPQVAGRHKCVAVPEKCTGTLPHGSAPNRSDHSRHAYTLHIIDGAKPYSATNWLQRDPALPLRGFKEQGSAG